jgi:SAM-dependent methyltransferase
MGEFVIVLEDDPKTGQRMKYYSRAADNAYWTELWKDLGVPSYKRESKGYFPHQLRDTFKKWVKPGSRVLEAGCGWAHFTVAAHALGYCAEGLDWSQDTIDVLRDRFPNISWHIGDVRGLEFDDGTFDAVYSPGVCEHFEEGPMQILAETRRILRPGGIAIISTPCLNRWLQERPDLFSSKSEIAGYFHQYGFTPDGMSGVLRDLGFDVLKVRPYRSLGTMIEFAGWKVPAPAMRPLGYLMDYMPTIQQRWGYSCIWVVRRPHENPPRSSRP